MKLQLKLIKKNRKYWCAKNWVALYASFSLNSNPSDNLPEPAEDLKPTSDFLEALGPSHDDNPAARTTDPIERYLEHCDNLNEAEFTGLLQASQESAMITKLCGNKMQIACLKFIARIYGADENRYMYVSIYK